MAGESKCQHEYDRYLPGATFNPRGMWPSTMPIHGGFSVCHKCRRIEVVFPGDNVSTIFENGRLQRWADEVEKEAEEAACGLLEYQIVVGGPQESMEERVRGFIRKGWRPQGGVTVDVHAPTGARVFAQAMVRGEE